VELQTGIRQRQHEAAARLSALQTECNSTQEAAATHENIQASNSWQARLPDEASGRVIAKWLQDVYSYEHRAHLQRLGQQRFCCLGAACTLLCADGCQPQLRLLRVAVTRLGAYTMVTAARQQAWLPEASSVTQ
jgi:hypothetical protein